MVFWIWLTYWVLITLIDQIVEHDLIENKRLKSYLSFILIWLLFVLLIVISNFFKGILPFIIWLNIYWLIVWKIHDIQFKIYILWFILILLKYYYYNAIDIFLISFTIFYNLFFKINYIKNILNKWKFWLLFYRFMWRYYLISLLFFLLFNNIDACLFNIWSTLISFLLAKKYII